MKVRLRKPTSKKGRINHRWGDLIPRAVAISKRSASTVYAVLSGRVKSKPVEEAIDKAREELRRERRRAA